MPYSDMRAQANMKAAIYRKNTGPCNNCEERHEACHSSCEKYKTWKESLNKDVHDFCKKYAEVNCGSADSKKRCASKRAYKRSAKGHGTSYDDRIGWHTRRKTD